MADLVVSKDPFHFVDVAFCCDEGYLPPLAAAMASLLAHARAPSRLRFWLLSRTLDPRSTASLAQLAANAGAHLELRSVRQIRQPLSSAPLREHLTEATYYRLLLPDALPSSLRRVIYLDCDLIARRAIEDLWATPLDGLPTAAVVNPRPADYAALGLASEHDYFNAGVMLIDLQRWRETHLHHRALHFVNTFEGPLPFLDQDALNHVHAGRWRRLDLRWNQQFKFFKHPAGYLRLSPSALARARREPFIIHYSTTSKPWHYTNDHPWRRLYFRYLDRTPFRGARPQPRSLHERMRRTMWSVVPHRWRPDVIRYNVPPRLRALKHLLVGARATRKPR
jgi:Lipopolysaccharide biosynthesis proteins, LPS:glycosyltransferases